jgi:glycosyltransferase involved in cell wall biosynthesis
MNKTSPLVTVVIPCYQVAQSISLTIESVIQQQYPTWEIILVDDGSTDDLQNQVASYLTLPTIHWISQPNQGVATARNVGASLAKGTYLLFLDGDDCLDPSYLTRCVKEMEQDLEVSLVYTDTMFFEAQSGLFVLPTYTLTQLLSGNCIPATALIRTAYFHQIGGYDVSFGYTEDWELWIRYLSRWPKAVHLKAPLFFYRKRYAQDSLTDLNAHSQDRIFDETRLRIYQKHYALYKSHGMGLENLHRAIAEESKYKDKYQNVWYRKWKNKLKGALKSRSRT